MNRSASDSPRMSTPTTVAPLLRNTLTVSRPIAPAAPVITAILLPRSVMVFRSRQDAWTPGGPGCPVGWFTASGGLGDAHVQVLLVRVGRRCLGMLPGLLRTQAAVHRIVEDGEAEDRDGAEVPPERQVVADLDAEHLGLALDVAAAEDREDGQAEDPRDRERAGPEVQRRLVRVEAAGNDVQDQEEDDGDVELDDVDGPAPVDDLAGDDEAERGDDVQQWRPVGPDPVRVAPAQ